MSEIQKAIWASTIPIHITLSPHLIVPPTPAPAPPPSPSPIPPSISRFAPRSYSNPRSNSNPSSPSPRASPKPPLETGSESMIPEAPPPYITNIPRLSYLPLLLRKLNAFFEKHTGGKQLSSFSYEGIELRALPVGLLVDLYGPDLKAPPGVWKIEVGEGWGGGLGSGKAVEDGWVNGVKEADFLRNGSAKAIMSMSRESSTSLWHSVLDNDLAAYNKIHTRLLNSSQPLRHIPLRIYLPQTDSDVPGSPALQSAAKDAKDAKAQPAGGSFKVVQALVTPRIQGGGPTTGRGIDRGGEPQTVGTALNQLLPSLFPSRRDAILAEVVLHGVRLPMRAVLEEVMREGAYSDGWVCLVVVMLN